MNRYFLVFVLVSLLVVGIASAHSIEALGHEVDPHSELGNIIFSLVIGIGLVCLIIVRTVVEWRKNGKK